MKKTLLSTWFLCTVGILVLQAQQQKLHQPNPRAYVSQGVERLSDPYVLPAAVTFTDNFDGPNDTTSLKMRGYLPYYRGSSAPGISPAWFTGWTFAPYFSAFNGPDSSYVASEYQSVMGAAEVDNWLVLPALPVDSGDTLSFYCRSPQGSTFLDSVEVMYSASGDSVPEGTSWVSLGSFMSDTSGMWVRKVFIAPMSGTMARFAIRHHVIDGGPLGNGSDYIGIDQIDVIPINTIGVPELKDRYSVQVYPNPVREVLRLHATGTLEQGEVSIFNAMGQQVWTRTITGRILSENVDVSDWKAGLYLVSVHDRYGHLFTSRIVVR